MQNIQGQFIALRPAIMQDMSKVYEWLAHSDITHLMLGPPDYPDNPIPTWEQFVSDYVAYYFNDEEPLMGRCFIIEHAGNAVGQVSYNQIFVAEKCVELDIWLAGSHVAGRGYGSDALKTLCKYLNVTFAVARFIIAPSIKNTQAIKAYQKAGFKSTDSIPSWFVPDYDKTLVMSMEID